MIYISTPQIKLKSSTRELFEFLSKTPNMAVILAFKKTKHLEVKGETITLILKWAARFNFSITSVTDKHVLIESTEEVEFSTAIRFDIEEERFGSSMVIHAETDTSPIVDFTFEAKLKNWIKAITNNIQEKFS